MSDKYGDYIVNIDRYDLDRLIKFDRHWTPLKTNGMIYARTNIYGRDKNNKYKLLHNLLLHRWILEFEKFDKREIDHKNHNGLDNQRNNFRITDIKSNTKHRKAKNSNNKSGYRNVAVVNGKYRVQIMINGRNTIIGTYDDVDEAGRVAEKARLKYYGEFAGES